LHHNNQQAAADSTARQRPLGCWEHTWMANQVRDPGINAMISDILDRGGSKKNGKNMWCTLLRTAAFRRLKSSAPQ
jgi:hypothetical protein